MNYISFSQSTRFLCSSYEKMISGMYMGEIAGRLIVQCAEQGLLFNGEVPPKLAEKPSNFFTKYVSEVEK